MRPGRVHLHELAPGDWFRFPGQNTPWKVLRVGESAVETRTRASKERVRFTEPGGRVRDFPASVSDTKLMAPGAEVLRLRAEAAP